MLPMALILIDIRYWMPLLWTGVIFLLPKDDTELSLLNTGTSQKSLLGQRMISAE